MCERDYPYDFDPRYSRRDFTGRSLVGRKDMDGIAVYGSCFSHETPESEVFPPEVKGLVLVRCNLDNVALPAGATAIDCTRRRFRVQNDLNDWLIDEHDAPVKPTTWRAFEKRGLPVPSPVGIPAQKVVEPVDLLAAAVAARVEVP